MESVRFVQFEARPLPSSPESETYAGAFVSIYTTASSDQEALDIATAETTAAGWQIIAIERQSVISRADAEELPEALPYFEQALLDGVVLVFDTYPHGGEEPEHVH